MQIVERSERILWLIDEMEKVLPKTTKPLTTTKRAEYWQWLLNKVQPTYNDFAKKEYRTPEIEYILFELKRIIETIGDEKEVFNNPFLITQLRMILARFKIRVESDLNNWRKMRSDVSTKAHQIRRDKLANA